MNKTRVLFVIKDFIIESLGIMYLSSALKAAGHQTDIVKADIEDFEAKVKKFSPHIIGYSVITGHHKFFLGVNSKLKKKFNFISIFGGPHPTFFHELLKENGVDIICKGEGEAAIVDLANKIATGEDFTNIANLWIKQNGQIFKNPVRPFAKINSLNYPDRELIYGRYKKSYDNPIKNFIGSRGCPYDCSYCYNHSLKEMYSGLGPYIRIRTVDNFIEEIIQVKNKYPLKMLYFQDDCFGMRLDWLEEFAEKYSKLINLPFHIEERANLITENSVALLKRAGCSGVSMAIETADDELRNKALEKTTTRQQILTAAKLLKKAGLELRTLNMLGLPGGSLRADLETLELNVKCKPDFAWSGIYQPYPRTRLGEMAIKMGLYDGNVDKISGTFFEESALDIPDRNKIINLQKLFSLTVAMPFLLPFTKFLIQCPPNKLFVRIHNFWKRRMNNKIYKT